MRIGETSLLLFGTAIFADSGRKNFPKTSKNTSVDAVLTRLETFLEPKPIRYMVSQRENSIDFGEIMNSGQDPARHRLRRDWAGRTHMCWVVCSSPSSSRTALARASIPEEKRRNFWLYIDEFSPLSSLLRWQGSITDARKFKLGLTLAHQDLSQLQPGSEIGGAILANASIRIVFRTGDARRQVAAVWLRVV